jgi:hypothetical protein
MDLPTTISDEELKKILSERDLKKIRSRVKNAKPVKLDEAKLTSIGIIKKKNKYRTDYISTPIVLDDVAVLRRIGDLEVPIHILTKENDKWEVKYTFYQKLIFH